jgi:hypothetical protein
MSKVNSIRKGCKDVFNAFLVAVATYAGFFEIPIIRPCYDISSWLIAFSRCISSKDHNYWVHFYEDDFLFERLWRNPKKYLPILQRYNGVILPDWSLYRDMPLVMQLWNIYRSRAIGTWLQANGVKVIPNLRYGDRRTFKVCTDGLSKHSVIAVGTHGTLKILEDRDIFVKGLDVVVRRIAPAAIVVYGACPDDIFQKYRDMGIKIYHFESEFGRIMNSHKEVV